MKSISAWMFVSLVAAGFGGYRIARAQTQATYNLTFSHAEESIDAAGATVITVMARGDLQGVMTLKLERGEDGSVTGGEWALAVSYTETPVIPPPNDNPITPPAGDNDPPENLVQKGVLKGQITGGAVALNEDGGVVALNGVQLELTGGTLAYGSVLQGGGYINGTTLTDRDTSSGSVSLIF
jgi:hypothetical protein